MTQINLSTWLIKNRLVVAKGEEAEGWTVSLGLVDKNYYI